MERNNIINALKSIFRKTESEINENAFKKLKRVLSSVIIAIIVWFVVINVVNPNISIWKTDIPINIKGENSLREKGLVIVGKEDVPKIAVKINGTRSELIDGMDRIRAEIDVSNISSLGTATVSPNINMPDYIGLEKQNFSYAEIMIEPAYKKEIPVVVKQTGEGKIDGKIVDSKSTVEKVEITGSKSDIDKAEYCIVNVSITPESESGTLMYTYDIVDSDEVKLDDNNTLYCSYNTIPIDNKVYEKHTIEIKPFIPEDTSDEYVMTIDEKSLSQNKIDVGITAGQKVPEKITAVLEAGQYTSGKTELKLQIPEGVYAKEKTVTAELKIEKREVKVMDVSVNVKNVPDGLKVSSPASLQMKLSVPESVSGNVKASVDASRCTEGENQLEIEFENENILAVDTNNITVVFEKK